MRCVRLYKQLAQIQRCLRLLVGIHVPPSSRFSRLHEEQNLRLWEVSWVAAGVEVVMGNPGKANLIQRIYFTRFVPLGLGSAQLGRILRSYCHQNQARPCFQSHKACICGLYRNTRPKRTFAQKYALEG